VSGNVQSVKYESENWSPWKRKDSQPGPNYNATAPVGNSYDKKQPGGPLRSTQLTKYDYCFE
jgi:hypothetical protein